MNNDRSARDNQLYNYSPDLTPGLAAYGEGFIHAHAATYNGHDLYYRKLYASQDFLINNVTLNGFPVMTQYQGKLYLVHQGSDSANSQHQLWYTVYDGSNWTEDYQVQNVALNESPAVVVYNGLLYVFFQGSATTGMTSSLWYTIFDGQQWSTRDIMVLDVGVLLSGSPAVTVHNGILFALYRYSSSSELHYTTFDGNNWSNDLPVVDNNGNVVNILGSPAVITCKPYWSDEPVILVAFTQTDQTFTYMEFDGEGNVSPGRQGIPDVVIADSPAAAATGDDLVFGFYSTMDQSQYQGYCTLTIGLDMPRPTVLKKA